MESNKDLAYLLISLSIISLYWILQCEYAKHIWILINNLFFINNIKWFHIFEIIGFLSEKKPFLIADIVDRLSVTINKLFSILLLL